MSWHATMWKYKYGNIGLVQAFNKPVLSSTGIHVAFPFLIAQPSPLSHVMLLHLSECEHKGAEQEEVKGKERKWKKEKRKRGKFAEGYLSCIHQWVTPSHWVSWDWMHVYTLLGVARVTSVMDICWVKDWRFLLGHGQWTMQGTVV